MDLCDHGDVGKSLAVSENVNVAACEQRITHKVLMLLKLSFLKIRDMLLNLFEFLFLIRGLMSLMAEMQDFQEVGVLGLKDGAAILKLYFVSYQEIVH